MLKIAAILMVAVLLTTCAISSTFAKYTTSGSSADEARVAKWGVNVSCNVTGLFAQTYGTTVATDTTNTYDHDDNNSTAAIAWDLVAPGTAGYADFSSLITGKPEVSVSVALNFDVELGEKWYVDTDTVYCPIVFKVGNQYFGFEGMKYEDEVIPATSSQTHIKCTSVENLETAVETALNSKIGTGGAATFGPNTDFGSKFTNIDFAWAWNFDNSNDVNDTKLGNKTGADIPTISVTIAPSITQID